MTKLAWLKREEIDGRAFDTIDAILDEAGEAGAVSVPDTAEVGDFYFGGGISPRAGILRGLQLERERRARIAAGIEEENPEPVPEPAIPDDQPQE